MLTCEPIASQFPFPRNPSCFQTVCPAVIPTPSSHQTYISLCQTIKTNQFELAATSWLDRESKHLQQMKIQTRLRGFINIQENHVTFIKLTKVYINITAFTFHFFSLYFYLNSYFIHIRYLKKKMVQILYKAVKSVQTGCFRYFFASFTVMDMFRPSVNPRRMVALGTSLVKATSRTLDPKTKVAHPPQAAENHILLSCHVPNGEIILCRNLTLLLLKLLHFM